MAAAWLSPPASAMSLGEGHILSHIGEPFSANIALLGNYDRDIRFYQVQSAECHSSIIGKTANGCDSLYEGPLTFLIKRRPDGQYFLRVDGEQNGELFYRIIIKSKTPAAGTVYNSFEFLPELRSNPDAAPIGPADGEAVIDNSLSGGKYGVVMDKIVEVLPGDTPREYSRSQKTVAPVTPKPAIAEIPDEIKPATVKEPKHASNETAAPQATGARPAVKKFAGSRLQIKPVKKYGEYSDDIYALQKENEEIEQQIALLAKQIVLLREVVRLKNQIGTSSIPEAAVAPAAPVSAPPATTPLPVQVQAAPQQNESETGLLTWVLLAVIAILAALLALVYRRQKISQAGASRFEFTPAVLSARSHNDGRESLDWTGSFEQKRL